MYPAAEGGIVIEKWSEFNVLHFGASALDDEAMQARTKQTFNETLESERLFTAPYFVVETTDLPFARRAAEETLATDGILGAFMRFRGIKRSAKHLLKMIEQV